MSNADRRVFRLGTRGSKLALAQSTWVAEQLRGRGHTVEIVEIKTQGDLQQQPSLAEVSQATGSQGLFTKELQRALLDETVDFAVHSMKDLPTEPIEGLGVAAIPEREVANDVLVGRFASIAELPQGARVGTGSLRRRAQLLHARPDLEVLGLRGNVDTRLRKLAAGNYDAIVLAGAGLHRLGLIDESVHTIPSTEMVPAPAQGALAIECRTADRSVCEALASLDDRGSRATAVAERAAMRRLEGGCLAALGAHARAEGRSLELTVAVYSEDGRQRRLESASGSVDAAEQLGRFVADRLLQAGARELLRPRS